MRLILFALIACSLGAVRVVPLETAETELLVKLKRSTEQARKQYELATKAEDDAAISICKKHGIQQGCGINSRWASNSGWTSSTAVYSGELTEDRKFAIETQGSPIQLK